MANFSQSKQVFLCNPMCGLRELCHETLQPIFTCQNLTCKPPQNVCMCETLGHFRTVCIQANSGHTKSVQNGGRDRGWSAWCQQLAVIMYLYTYNFSPQISTNLENDLGDDKKVRIPAKAGRFPSLTAVTLNDVQGHLNWYQTT